MSVLSEKEWNEQGFIYAAELELKDYLAGESRAELAQRFADVFRSRNGVYSLHWRSVIGAEGYNYACENQGRVQGCRRGVDNCKNCRAVAPIPFDAEAAAKHLSGEITAGFYPVFPDGTCRFLVFEPGGREKTQPLREVCREFDIPAYCELIGRRTRLWIFFAEAIPLPHLRRLGRALVTLAAERSETADFGLYDGFVPCRGEICPGDMGFEVTLPFGRHGRDTGVFVDENYQPLPHGPAELFRVRTVTRGCLADRLGRLDAVASWPDVSGGVAALPDGTGLEVVYDGDLAVKKAGLSPRAALMLRRISCVRNREQPFGEFEPLDPSIFPCYTEDGDFIRLPRGLRSDLERLVRASGGKLAVEEAEAAHERAYLSLTRPVAREQEDAARAVAAGREGILLAPLGWGKTAAAARLIELKGRRTLIIVPDIAAKERWERNVMEYFGIDAGRNSAKIQVRIAGERRLKGKFGLVLLADCSRLPMDGEIFAHIRELRPEFIYGITAFDRRRDGRWPMIRMLCGPVVFEA